MCGIGNMFKEYKEDRNGGWFLGEGNGCPSTVGERKGKQVIIF